MRKTTQRAIELIERWREKAFEHAMERYSASNNPAFWLDVAAEVLRLERETGR